MTITEPTGISVPDQESLKRLHDTRFQMVAERIAGSNPTAEDTVTIGEMHDKFLSDAIGEAAEGKLVSAEGHVYSSQELTDQLVVLAKELKEAIKKGDQSLVASALLGVTGDGSLREGVDRLLRSDKAIDFLESLDRLSTPEVEARISAEVKLGETAAKSSAEVSIDEQPVSESVPLTREEKYGAAKKALSEFIAEKELTDLDVHYLSEYSEAGNATGYDRQAIAFQKMSDAAKANVESFQKLYDIKKQLMVG